MRQTVTKKNPKLRFSEFRDEWQLKKLHDVLFESKKRNFKGEFDKNDVLSVSGEYGIVNQIKFKGRSFAGVSVLNYHIVETDDIVYTKSPLKDNPYGIIKYNSGKPGIVSTLYAVYKPQQNTNSKFIDYYFRLHNNVNNYLRPLVHKGAKNDMKISNSHVLDGSIYITSFEEQEKIVNFLTSVDLKIEKLAKKLELLKKYKKGIMQKIFSQKIRFNDEKGNDFPDWEEKSLGDVFERIKIKNKINDKTVLTISAQYGLINQEDFFNKTVAAKDLSGYYLLHKGDFAYNKSYSNGYPMGAIKRLNKYDKGVVSTLYICFRIKANNSSDFFEHYFDNGLQNSEIGKIAQEGARNHGLLNISVIEFFEQVFLQVPSIQEQQKIAGFLSAIDHKIQLEERELSNAKKFKKALLQQMFA